MRHDRARPLGRALFASLLLLTACSGDDDEAAVPTTAPPDDETTAFVADVCGGTVRWRDELGDLVEELSRSGVGVDDVAARKQMILDFVDDGAAVTATFVSGIAAEAPSAVTEERMRLAADELAADWAAAREEAEAFPDDVDPEPFVSRGIQMTNRMEQTAATWKSAVRDVRAASPDLEPAFAADPTCRVIPRTADQALSAAKLAWSGQT